MRRYDTLKHIVYGLLALFITVTFLHASETRVSTMGNTAIFLKDQSNVMLFPGTLLKYSNLVIGEMRAKNDDSRYTLGVHMDYDKMASGLYVNMPVFSPLLTTGLGNFAGLTATIRNSYVFMLGMDLGGMDVGFGIQTAGSKFETGSGAAKTDESASYIGLMGGVSNDKMDIGGLIELPSIEQKAGGVTSDYSGFGITANGRMYLMKHKGATIFPVGRLTFGSSSFEVKNGGSVDYSTLIIAGGVGVEKEINENNLLIVGLELFSLSSLTSDIKDGTETNVSTITLPGIYVGVESRISSWLIGRLGASHTNQQTVTEITPDGGNKAETTTEGSAFNMSLGLGMEFGSFLLDFAFNEGLLFDGPAIVSNRTNVLATKISVTYNFGGDDE